MSFRAYDPNSADSDLPNRKMNVAIRVDSSRAIGTGHVMRCLALARCLRDHHCNVMFVCQELEGNIIPAITKEGFICHTFQLAAGSGEEDDARSFSATLAGRSFQPDWVIVDQYELGEGWEKLAGKGRKVAAIDDLANRRHDCAILIDTSYVQSAEKRYDGLVPDDCKLLLGPRYTMLRHEFAKLRSEVDLPRSGKVESVLVFFGGADATNQTSKVLDVLLPDPHRTYRLRVVVGISNPQAEQIKQRCSEADNCEFHIAPSNFGELMRDSDLMIGAGGTTTWERCVLGIPSIVITVAANQEVSSQTMGDEGLALYLGRDSEVSAELLLCAVTTAVNNPWLLRHFSRSSAEVVDGLGSLRVVRALMAPQIELRRAVLDDVARTHQWRNSALVRRISVESGEIPFEHHRSWFLAALKDPNRILLIGERSGVPVGVLRFDVKGPTASVSIYLDPQHTKSGIGPVLLQAGIKWVREYASEISWIYATILEENIPSQRLFRDAGFLRMSSDYRLEVRR